MTDVSMTCKLVADFLHSGMSCMATHNNLSWFSSSFTGLLVISSKGKVLHIDCLSLSSGLFGGVGVLTHYLVGVDA